MKKLSRVLMLLLMLPFGVNFSASEINYENLANVVTENNDQYIPWSGDEGQHLYKMISYTPTLVQSIL